MPKGFFADTGQGGTVAVSKEPLRHPAEPVPQPVLRGAANAGYHAPVTRIGEVCRLAFPPLPRRRWAAPVIDAHGRLRLGELAEVLGWEAGAPLVYIEERRLLFIRERTEVEGTACASSLRVDAAGRLYLPAGLRARLAIRAGARVLIGASPETRDLFVACFGLVEELVEGDLR